MTEHLTPLNAFVRVDSLRISDGQTLNLDSINTVVFVGPNNAGKSKALREIEALARAVQETLVIKKATFSKVGSAEDVIKYLDEEYLSTVQSGYTQYSGMGVNLYSHAIEGDWPKFNEVGSLTHLFVKRLSTDDRLSGSNAVNSLDLRVSRPNHPIQHLQNKEYLENRSDSLFQQAFGENLIVDRFRGSKVGLLVGVKPEVDVGHEDRISDSYRVKIDESMNLLDDQGDGMRAFATITSAVESTSAASILLIDEPEAFLHPPQAKFLGGYFGDLKAGNKQIFIATHSPDFLQGILESAGDSTLVVRLQREGSVNAANVLDIEVGSKLAADPIARHSSLVNGVFHKRSILCESDGDCMFYGAILDSVVNAGQLKDVQFTQTGGKHRVAEMLKTLRNLGVPSDVIVDIDVLREKSQLKRLVVAAGGDWEEVETQYDALVEALVSMKSEKRTRDLQEFFEQHIAKLEPNSKLDGSLKKGIQEIFAQATIWGQLKKAGENLIPNGTPTSNYKHVKAYFQSLGVWIVPVGEIEGFYKSIGGHGPKWVREVLSSVDVASDAELDAARKFVTQIWKSR